MSNDSPVITSDQAVIKSATVEIKVIRIGNKQMTQAVYNQLPFGSLLDEQARDYRVLALLGVPWGRVRHHDKWCPDCKHIHVLWQDGATLKRSTIVHPRAGYNGPPGAVRMDLHDIRHDIDRKKKQSNWPPSKETENDRKMTIDHLEAIFQAKSEHYQEYLALYEQAYADLLLLDQLFIAV